MVIFSLGFITAEAAASGKKVETQVAEIGGITRSGWCYTQQDFSTIRDSRDKQKRQVKQAVTDKDAHLKLLRRSEYRVIELLSKTPAQIPILSLLLISETHRAALLKVLNEAHVPNDITTENFEHFRGSVMATNLITFSDDEIPPGQSPPHSCSKCWNDPGKGPTR